MRLDWMRRNRSLWEGKNLKDNRVLRIVIQAMMRDGIYPPNTDRQLIVMDVRRMIEQIEMHEVVHAS